MTSVSYMVPPTWTAGADKTGASKNKNPNDPNMLTTGAYGNAFELALHTTTNSDGTRSDTLAYKSYTGKTNGTVSAASEMGTGSDLASAYQGAALRDAGERRDDRRSRVAAQGR